MNSFQGCYNTGVFTNLLSVRDDDNEDGWDAEKNYDDSESQQRAFCVAQRLHGFLHILHNVRCADLPDSASPAQVRLELLIYVQ